MLYQTNHSLLKKCSSTLALIVLFVLTHIVLLLMMVFTFPKINEQLEGAAFDLLTFGYSYEEALFILEQLDEDTTALYLFPQLLLFDILYPALLTLFLASMIYRLCHTKALSKNTINLLLAAPFLAMTFDYLENGCIISMLTDTAPPSKSFVRCSSTFTILKGSFTTIAWGILFVLMTLVLRARWFSKK